jgi:hypothetical protein
MTLYQLGEEYLKQADDLKVIINAFTAERKTQYGVALFELNSKIAAFKEMERDIRILGKKLLNYYSGNDCKKAYYPHRYN